MNKINVIANLISENSGAIAIEYGLIGALILENSGATAIEYALIAALIAVVGLGSIQAIGTELQENFQATADAFAE